MSFTILQYHPSNSRWLRLGGRIHHIEFALDKLESGWREGLDQSINPLIKAENMMPNQLLS